MKCNNLLIPCSRNSRKNKHLKFLHYLLILFLYEYSHLKFNLSKMLPTSRNRRNKRQGKFLNFLETYAWNVSHFNQDVIVNWMGIKIFDRVWNWACSQVIAICLSYISHRVPIFLESGLCTQIRLRLLHLPSLSTKTYRLLSVMAVLCFPFSMPLWLLKIFLKKCD